MDRAEELLNRIKANGVDAIRALVDDRQSEYLLLDFKRSAKNGQGKRLDDNDRNNLAKAISGFGNSAGGVIIWGIDCRSGTDGADVAKAEHPLEDAKRFKSWLEGAVSGCTIPPHNGVVNEAIEMGDGVQGFVVTYIPQSNHAPHQVVPEMKYYMRAGSDFVPVPHQILAGMFGRRPQPNVVGRFATTAPEVTPDNTIRCQLDFLQHNLGPGIARDIFLNAVVLSKPGNSCEISCDFPDKQNWSATSILYRGCSLISLPAFRLPPGAYSQPLVMDICFKPPFNADLHIERTDGCDGMAPCTFSYKNSRDEIEQIYSEFVEKHRKGTLTDEDLADITYKLIGQHKK